jgi:hypothetical protein
VGIAGVRHNVREESVYTGIADMDIIFINCSMHFVVLLHHVNTFPTSTDADTTRLAIDGALSLCSSDGDILGVRHGRLNHRVLKEGEKEAWNLIRRLRVSAWLKVGLDLAILPTREETVERIRPRLASYWPGRVRTQHGRISRSCARRQADARFRPCIVTQYGL